MARRRDEVGHDRIAAVYHARFDAFASVASAIVRDAGEGRDVVQDAFATALRRRGGFRGDGSLEAWLWQIVVNTARSRSRKRVPVPTDRAVDAHGEVDGPATDVRDALASLPERQRLVLFLRYYADLDYATIATAIEVAPGTVGATVHAALAALRRRLEEVPA